MGIDFAIDELYATGWTATDPASSHKHQDGRPIPSLEDVHAAFTDAGFELSVRHIQLFDCYRAEWRDTSGGASGAVVGQRLVNEPQVASRHQLHAAYRALARPAADNLRVHRAYPLSGKSRVVDFLASGGGYTNRRRGVIARLEPSVEVTHLHPHGDGPSLLVHHRVDESDATRVDLAGE